MARNASRALAGFFPLPPHLLPIITAMVRPEPTMMQAHLHLADPCAGEGHALAELGRCHTNVSFYACEMEEGRYEKLKHRPNFWRHTAHGDFFHLRFTPGMIDVCLLNPPYDQDRKFRRLEARWLHFATPMLCEGGVLVFVVPHYCLSACADSFARHYADLKVYRFPGTDFDTFKQVIVFARRAIKAAADPEIAALCRAHALDAGLAPELPPLAVAHLHTTPAKVKNRHGATVWEMTAYDGKAVAALNPWQNERGPISGLCPPADLCSRLSASYPVVSPPRPVHLVSALSAGVFNGLHVHPNEGRNLPPLLVKGTFRRVWEKVDEKRNKDGKVVSETEIERPELEVWVLDMEAGKFHLLAPSGELTNPSSLENATFADLLDAYSGDLLAALRSACPVLHDPARDEEPPVSGLVRPLWPAQLSTVHAADKHTASGANGIVIVGEVGTGKTSIALALLHKRRIGKSLVICPPHLLKSWTDQVRMVLPAHYDVVIVDSISTIRDLERHPGPVVAILSREGAKLGHGWRDLSRWRCPKCGGIIEADGAAAKRSTCQHAALSGSDTLTRWVLDRRDLLRRVFPKHDGVRNLFPPTRGASRFLSWTERTKPSANAAARGRLEAELSTLYALLSGHQQAAAILPLLAWALPQTAVDGLALLPEWSKGQPSELARIRERVALAIHPSTPIDLGAHPEESEGYTYTSGILAGQRYGEKSRSECWKNFNTMRRWLHVEGVTDPGYSVSYSYSDYKPGKYRDHGLGSDGALEALITELLLACSFKVDACGEPLFQATPAPRRYPLGTYIAKYKPDLFGAIVVDEAHEFAALDESAQGIMAARLAQVAQKRGTLLLYLTGSLVNGYADSAFHALRATSPKFRARFNHKDREAFVDSYGLRKRVVVLDEKATIKEYGAQSDRRQIASTRKAGQAPGVLPRLLLDHLLGSAAVLHQDDLELNLPPATEETITIDLLPQQRDNLDFLFGEVKDAIAKTRFQPLLAGRLFGAITGLLAYPDLAFEEYTVRWPDGVPVCQVKDLMIGPGYPVATVPAIDPTTLLPKEAAFLNKLSEQLGQDRGVLALPVHRETLDRLEWVLDQAGIEAAVLRADKVAPSKREGWIDTHLNGTGGRGARRRRVLLVNPTAVQTGLNNLVSLATPLWYENPECKPIVRRQANGRIRRPGQVLDVLVSTLLYDHPITRAGHKLLMHKVGVSMAVDGLDPQAVFEAAGVLTEFKAGLSVGRQLYDMLIQGASR